MSEIPAGSRYVAMGSSFGAGPGIAPRAPGSPRRACRSASNYAHLVARDLGLDLHDVTYSGATTADILRPSARGQPAQLDAVTRATRLVTLTAGGNDVGYLPRLTLASLPWPLRMLPRARAQVAGFGDPAATDERFASLGRNLQAIARGVADRAPDCRILFVDYLTILPPGRRWPSDLAPPGPRPAGGAVPAAGACPAPPPPGVSRGRSSSRGCLPRLTASRDEGAQAAAGPQRVRYGRRAQPVVGFEPAGEARRVPDRGRRGPQACRPIGIGHQVPPSAAVTVIARAHGASLPRRAALGRAAGHRGHPQVRPPGAAAGRRRSSVSA